MSCAILRAGLLAGVRVAVAGEGELGRAVAARAAALGAIVDPSRHDSSPVDPSRHHSAPADVLVWDGAAALGSADGVAGVHGALDGAWLAVRGVAVESWIARGVGGLIVLVGPRPGDAHAEAARAGLENLARTLSIEWSRHEIRPVAVLPGAGTRAAEVAELVAYLASAAGVAYLASAAGNYYSGCALTLA